MLQNVPFNEADGYLKLLFITLVGLATRVWNYKLVTISSVLQRPTSVFLGGAETKVWCQVVINMEQWTSLVSEQYSLVT